MMAGRDTSSPPNVCGDPRRENASTNRWR